MNLNRDWSILQRMPLFFVVAYRTILRVSIMETNLLRSSGSSALNFGKMQGAQSDGF